MNLKRNYFPLSETQRLIEVIDKRIKKCLKEYSKQVSNVLIHTAKTELNKLCKNKNKRLNELLDAAPCANKANKEVSDNLACHNL